MNDLASLRFPAIVDAWFRLIVGGNGTVRALAKLSVQRASFLACLHT